MSDIIHIFNKPFDHWENCELVLWRGSLMFRGFNTNKNHCHGTMYPYDEFKADYPVDPTVLRSKYVISSEDWGTFATSIDRWLAAYHI